MIGMSNYYHMKNITLKQKYQKIYKILVFMNVVLMALIGYS